MCSHDVQTFTVSFEFLIFAVEHAENQRCVSIYISQVQSFKKHSAELISAFDCRHQNAEISRDKQANKST